MRRQRLRLAGIAVCGLICAACVTGSLASRTGVAQGQKLDMGKDSRSRPIWDVRILCDGAERHVRTAQTSVGATLKEAGIQIGPADIVYPPVTARIVPQMNIRVIRVREEKIAQKLPVACRVIRKPTNRLRPGLTQVQSEGSNGEKLVYYRVRYEDGVETKRTKLRSVIMTPPKDRVILVGQREFVASRGFISARRTLRMRASAYDPGPRSCGRSADGRTACGMRAGYGVVAVDPQVISLGSRLYIEGYGFAIAGDTGRAIRGNRIDLGFDSHRAATRFGRRWVTVHVLN